MPAWKVDVALPSSQALSFGGSQKWMSYLHVL